MKLQTALEQSSQHQAINEYDPMGAPGTGPVQATLNADGTVLLNYYDMERDQPRTHTCPLNGVDAYLYSDEVGVVDEGGPEETWEYEGADHWYPADEGDGAI